MHAPRVVFKRLPNWKVRSEFPQQSGRYLPCSASRCITDSRARHAVQARGNSAIVGALIGSFAAPYGTTQPNNTIQDKSSAALKKMHQAQPGPAVLSRRSAGGRLR